MPQPPVSIRPARRDDADFLTWAILASTRSHLRKGWFDIAMGGSEQTSLGLIGYLTTARERSFWHYSYFLVGETDGKPVAALSVFPADEGYARSSDAMREAMARLDLSDAEQQAVWKRADYLWSCVLSSDNDPDVWAIENVATLPEHRGRGVAGALLERAVGEAQRNGARRLHITFLVGNAAAEKAYAKAGFKFRDEKRSAAFEAACSAPGLRRYTRDL